MTDLEWCRSVDWGTAPAWIGAIGSLLAFALAVRIYSVNSKDRRMEQARMVSMLISGPPTRLRDTGTTITELRSDLPIGLTQIGGTHYQASGDLALWNLTLWNRSDETVSAVGGEILSADGTEVARLHAFGSLGPNTEKGFSAASAYDPSFETQYRLRFRFTDAAGRQWVREQDRPLRKSKKADAARE